LESSDDYTGSFEQRPINRYEVMGLASFELDLFGRLKNMSEAALQSYLATEEAEKTIRISLVSQVGQSYLDERLATELLSLAERTLATRRATHAFIESRVQSGQSSLLDLEQARSMVEVVSAEVADRRQEVLRAGNALSLLLGSFEHLNLPPATPLMEQRFADLPQGIASSVLLKRPDVMEAEHMLRAADADIGAARAAFFPSISLTGRLGYMSEDLSYLFAGPSSFWSFLPRINLPVFSGGANRANLDLAELRKERSILQYEQAIQNAFREAADTLKSKALLADRLAAQKRYLASQHLVLELAMTNYINGASTYLVVLDAQRGVFEAEQTLLSIRRAQLGNEISLYSALGGGMNVTDSERPAAQLPAARNL
jgi:Cu(I)/Ag(I) efflux system outer membrane protein